MQASEFPRWVQYVQALGPTVVAIIAALIAGYIALRQWLTARDRLRFDLFEKRFAVYEAAKKLVRKGQLNREITPEDLDNFFDGTRGAEFLFDRDIQLFLNMISAFREIKSDPRSDSAGDEALLRYLQQQDQRLEDLFRRYIQIATATRRWRSAAARSPSPAPPSQRRSPRSPPPAS